MKMNVFDSSAVEALAFSYLSHGLLMAVHNLWTWVAVVTAALSFWRIRVRAVSSDASAVVVRDHSDHSRRPRPVETIPERVQIQPSTSASDNESEPSMSTPSPVTSNNAETTSDCINGVTKRRKFSIKFEDEAAEEVDERFMRPSTERRPRVGDGDVEWWGSWERLLRTKNGEMSWCRYQDLKAINGNVVRLWEDCVAGSRRYEYSSSCTVR